MTPQKAVTTIIGIALAPIFYFLTKNDQDFVKMLYTSAQKLQEGERHMRSCDGSYVSRYLKPKT